MKEKMIDLFLWWMTERHDIYLRREVGKPWPWTEDPILREFKFTNVYRQLDRVTVELNKRMEALHPKAMLHDRLFHVILFRGFNWPQTYDRLMEYGAVSENMPSRFDARGARGVLNKMMKNKEKVFTGAYIITAAGESTPKYKLMCDALEEIHEQRIDLWNEIELDGTMQGATKILAKLPMHGKFTAYEVVCDLRYQKGMLDGAKDKMYWANLGPGARRGIQRIVAGGADVRLLNKGEEWFVEQMRELMDIANDRLPKRMPRLEMREIEHSLCEYDKFMRVKRGEGRPRSRYVRQP